jgi:hypothetical protein
VVTSAKDAMDILVGHRAHPGERVPRFRVPESKLTIIVVSASENVSLRGHDD